MGKMGAKMKVIDEIMGLMDELDAKSVKGKGPDAATIVKVEKADMKPKVEMEVEKPEMEMMEGEEDKGEKEMELDPEMVKELLKKLSK